MGEQIEEAKDIRDKMAILNDMSRDLRVEVVKADPELDEISENIDSIEGDLELGQTDLIAAVGYHKKNNRMKRMMFWSSIILILAGVALIISSHFRTEDGPDKYGNGWTATIEGICCIVGGCLLILYVCDIFKCGFCNCCP